MYGESMLPIRAHEELAPIPAFRMTVGKISDDQMYTDTKEDVAPNFPSRANTVVTHCKPKGEFFSIEGFVRNRNDRVFFINNSCKKTLWLSVILHIYIMYWLFIYMYLPYA